MHGIGNMAFLVFLQGKPGAPGPPGVPGEPVSYQQFSSRPTAVVSRCYFKEIFTNELFSWLTLLG